MKAIGFLLLLVTLAGCIPQPTVVSRTEVGRVLDATNPPNTWNDSVRTRIQCERAVVIAPGLCSVMVGQSAAIVYYSDGDKYLFIAGERYGIKIF